MSENKITKQDLNKVFFNTFTLAFPFNFEKLQTIGFLHCMTPVLKRIYKDADKETKVAAMKRHLEFYNSQQNTGALILGIAAALEEKTDESEKDAVVAMKTGLMGPFAGLGDSLLKFTWMPICGSIGAAFALEGNILGPIIMFIMFNIINIGSRYYGIHIGYQKGINIIESSKNSNIIQRITTMSNVLGVIVLGAMVATTVRVSTPLLIEVGEQSIAVQEMFDKVMPNLLTLLTTLGMFFLFKKTNGKYTVTTIFAIMVICVLGKYIGIF